MMKSPLLSILLLLYTLYLPCTHALITLDTMRNLTSLTDECRERILNAEEGEGVVVVGMSGLLSEQVVLSPGHGEKNSVRGERAGQDEIEDVRLMGLKGGLMRMKVLISLV